MQTANNSGSISERSMNERRILLIEDEDNISRFITTVLNASGCEVLRARNYAEGMMNICSRCPDVVLLDLGLPDRDGIDLIRAVREFSRVPIIVVSARNYERDKVEALDCGADDYIIKPFGTSELLARIRTALRHYNEVTYHRELAQSYTGGELFIDFNSRLVTLRSESVHLTKTEYKLIALLARHAGKVLTYDFIIKELWGPNGAADNQILRVNMANIRRKIEKNPAAPEYIFTEVGVGYRMREFD